MEAKTYEDNGLSLSQKTLHDGDKLKISYYGLLARAGAESIYLHAGYGSDWDSSSYIEMEKVPEGFKAEIEVQAGKSLGICFKDSADNWDNNSGENYIFKITARSIKKDKSSIKDENSNKSEKSRKAGAKKTKVSKAEAGKTNASKAEAVKAKA
jgi:hypothetical protein